MTSLYSYSHFKGDCLLLKLYHGLTFVPSTLYGILRLGYNDGCFLLSSDNRIEENIAIECFMNFDSMYQSQTLKMVVVFVCVCVYVCVCVCVCVCVYDRHLTYLWN